MSTDIFGGGGSTQTTQTQTIPPWLQGYAENFLGSASNVANLPFVPYNGQRVADLSPLQQQSIQNIADLSGGTPSMQAGADMLTRTLQGGYSNPFAQSNVSGGGQYSFDPINAGSNEFIGMNPQFQAMRQGALDDITNNYQTAIAPEITRIMNLSGNLGGSAHLNAMSNAQRNLAQQLGRASAQMTSDEYNRSGALRSEDLSRGLNAGQFNASLGNTAFENSAQRGLNAGQFNANLGSSAYENERNRQMQGVGASANLYNSLLNGQNMALNAGDVERNQIQSLLNSQYQDFQDWRNYPDSRIGLFGNALSSILGRAGGSTQTNQGLPPRDLVSNGLGIFALANLFR